MLAGPGGCLLPGVCVSGPGGVCSRQVSAPRGVSAPGVSAPGGCVCSRGSTRGVVPGGDPPDGYCCGRYASYWNAFLLSKSFLQFHFTAVAPSGFPRQGRGRGGGIRQPQRWGTNVLCSVHT